MKQKTMADNMREIANLKINQRFQEFNNTQGKLINQLIARITIEADNGGSFVIFNDDMFDAETNSAIKTWMPQIIRFLESQGFRAIEQQGKHSGFGLIVDWVQPS